MKLIICHLFTIYLFEKERERRGRGRGRGRILSRLLAQHGAQHRAQSHYPEIKTWAEIMCCPLTDGAAQVP